MQRGVIKLTEEEKRKLEEQQAHKERCLEVYNIVKKWKDGKINRLQVQKFIDEQKDREQAKKMINERLATIRKYSG